MKQLLTFVLTLLLLASCQSRDGQQKATGGDTLRFSYARLLTVVKYDHYTVARVADPWKAGHTLHTYVLIDRKDSAKVENLPEGTKVYVPIRRSVVFTTAHCQLLEWLHAADQISGVADLQYINIPDIQQRVLQKKIIDCGNGMQPSIEHILDLKADALLLSPFENSGGYGKLEQTGIPIIEAADYMEPSPLARAEWMRFYGLLYGKEETADSLFTQVETSYLLQCKKAKKQAKRQSVLTERITGNVWYVPGGQSTTAIMIADAGGQYPFSYDRHAGSLQLSLEQVIEKASGADTWLVKYNAPARLTRASLLAECNGYKALKAFRTGNVYACDCTSSHYFEETPFHPDYLLQDLIQIVSGEEKHLRL